MTRCLKAKRTGSIALPVLPLLAILVLSGCGGSDDSASTASSQTSPASAEAGNGSGEGQGKTPNAQGNKSSSTKQNSNVPQSRGEEEPGITPEQKRTSTTANITLESPSFKAGASLPVKYTCDGENSWPPFRWSGVPREAEELVLLVLSNDPAEQELLFDWAVGGLDPSLTSIEEGQLPEGAVIGENSFGKSAYHVCPPQGESESYVFMLFAIPKALNPEPGFDAAKLRAEVLAEHGSVGLLIAPYQR